MELTIRSLWTLVHGLGFGALYLLAASGALVEIYHRYHPSALHQPQPDTGRFTGYYLAVLAALSWLTVLTGTYILYPWYRLTPPAGTLNLADYPRALLLANPATRPLHLIGMEWKEHVAWLAPIAITAAAALALRHGRNLKRRPQLRFALLSLVAGSLLATALAGFFGALLDKTAPLNGGAPIHLAEGVKP